MTHKKNEISLEKNSGKNKKCERTVLLVLRLLRLLMESGSNAKVLHEAASRLADGLRLELLGLRVGYASITLTMKQGDDTASSTVTVGRIGVNHRLDYALRDLVTKIGVLSLDDMENAMTSLVKETPRHAAWFVALCVGVACASFGRLFGMDWLGFPAACVGASVGQFVRHHLIHGGKNVFVVAAFVAFLASGITGILAFAVGSETVNLAMVASILLLVPGVPATNAQSDIMDGFPTLGSARAVTVLMIMVFATVGIWVSQTLLGVR